jgi:hypothetical protein
MREIKFRAWDGKKMVSPAYLSRNEVAYWYEDLIPLCSFYIMQFTGLKDKNGVDIYEGDILETDTSTIKGEVFYKEGCFFVYHSGLLLDRYKNSQVIGNIYENN